VKKNIIIVLGEPNSISSEIFLKSINYIKKTNLNFIIIGNYTLLKKQANYLNFKKNINFRLSKIDNLKKNKISFICNVFSNSIVFIFCKFRLINREVN